MTHRDRTADVRKGLAVLRQTAENRRAAGSPMGDVIARYADAIEAALAAERARADDAERRLAELTLSPDDLTVLRYPLKDKNPAKWRAILARLGWVEPVEPHPVRPHTPGGGPVYRSDDWRDALKPPFKD